MTSLLGVQEVKQFEKYLGLPTLMGRNKKASLRFIKERVWTKLQGWKEQLLSQAGREIFLKAVVQAIPTFAMSCFKVPISLCNDIEQLIRKFYWGHCGNQRKIHWSKWSTLCLPKDMGGMGFKELQNFNDAMLAKQVWRLLENKSSLFHRFFKAKFFPKGTIFYAKVDKGSFAWKSILKGQEIIKKGTQWRVGNGKNILIYKDNWLPDPQHPIIHSPPTFFYYDAQVSILIDKVWRCWIEEAVDNNFLAHEAKLIKAIPLSLNEVNDLLY